MSTIDLRTTQQVTIEYELATLGERGLAALVDIMIVGAGSILLITVLLNAFAQVEEVGIGFWIGFVPVVSFLGYHFLFESMNHGQTLGKKALALQVVRTDGLPPRLGDHALRTILHLADTLVSGGVLAALFISASPLRQRLGDLTAGTTVVKTRSSRTLLLDDILRISSLDDYQPRFLEVRRLSEAEVLLIKRTLARSQRYPNEAHLKAVHELARQLSQVLEIAPHELSPTDFLRTLIKDYIVLTR